MKYLLCVVTVLALSLQNAALGQINGKVALKISDTVQKPLDGIMVQLVKARDSSMALYAFTGQDGAVEFTHVKYDRYRIYISQVGYGNYFSAAFRIDSLHKEISLPEVMLKSQSLKEVVVESKIPIIQHF